MRYTQKKTQRAKKSRNKKFANKSFLLSAIIANNDIKTNDLKKENSNNFANIIKSNNAINAKKNEKKIVKRDKNVRIQKEIRVNVLNILLMRKIRQIKNFNFDIFEFVKNDNVFETFIRKKIKRKNVTTITNTNNKFFF